MPETPQPSAERAATPERQAASRATVAHVAAGKFDHAESVTSLPKEVSRNAFDALNKHSIQQRQQDEAAYISRLKQEGVTDKKIVRHNHMSAWTAGSVMEINRLVAAGQAGSAETTQRTADIAKALQKLHISLDPAETFKSFYDDAAGQPGEFYKRFCGTDMPEQLAKTLTFNEMMLLKPFLTNRMLGSEEAFDALITLRTAIDTVAEANSNPKTKALIESEITGTISDDDKKRLGLFQKWHAINEDDLKKTQAEFAQADVKTKPQTRDEDKDEKEDENEALPANAGAEADTENEAGSIAGAGFSSTQGRRAEMEDAHVMEQNLGGKTDREFYAVYDGHGGKDVADKAAVRLHQNLIEQLDTNHLSPIEALKAAYAATDESMRDENTPGGATALTALVEGSKLYVANLGDARAVMIHGNGEAERLSHDRKASDPAEQKEVEDRGGTVINGRVQSATHTLAVSAALGDFEYQGLRRDPDIREVDLNSTDRWVILACDGVWDKINDDEVAGIIGNETDPQEVSRLLMQAAYDKGSGDNLSVIALAVGEAPQPAAQPEPASPLNTAGAEEPIAATNAAELLNATAAATPTVEEPQSVQENAEFPQALTERLRSLLPLVASENPEVDESALHALHDAFVLLNQQRNTEFDDNTPDSFWNQLKTIDPSLLAQFQGRAFNYRAGNPTGTEFVDFLDTRNLNVRPDTLDMSPLSAENSTSTGISQSSLLVKIGRRERGENEPAVDLVAVDARYARPEVLALMQALYNKQYSTNIRFISTADLPTALQEATMPQVTKPTTVPLSLEE